MVLEAATIASATRTSIAKTAFSASGPAECPAPAMGVTRELPRIAMAVVVAQFAGAPNTSLMRSALAPSPASSRRAASPAPGVLHLLDEESGQQTEQEERQDLDSRPGFSPVAPRPEARGRKETFLSISARWTGRFPFYPSPWSGRAGCERAGGLRARG